MSVSLMMLMRQGARQGSLQSKYRQRPELVLSKKHNTKLNDKLRELAFCLYSDTALAVFNAGCFIRYKQEGSSQNLTHICQAC